MLKDRLKSGLLMGGALLAAVAWLPQEWMPIVLIPICVLATGEFHSLLDAHGIPTFRLIISIASVVLLGATWYAPDQPEIESAVVFATVAAVFLRQLRYRDSEKPWETVACSLISFLYVPFLFNHLVKLLLLGGQDESGRYLILYLVLVVKSTDIGAYFTGCTLGRHKFCPRISPAKTWEGVIGGVITGTLVSIAYQRWAADCFPTVPFTALYAAVLGFVLSVAGVAGDLIESVFKRASGVKDSAGYIRGMGGLLDVLDSLLFTAPILYYAVRLLEQIT